MAKKKKKAEKQDEFSVDFSSVKNIFKSKGPKKKEPAGPKGKAAYEIDLARFLRSKAFVIIILLIIAMFFSIYFRSYPVHLPMAKDWAENNVYNFYKSQIAQQVNSQYPNLPQQNRNELINKEFAKFLDANRKNIENQVDQTAEELKKQFKWGLPNGEQQTYLLAIDPYFYYRRVRNLAETGHVHDEVRNGIPIDNHMVAPLGAPVKKPDFHSLFSFYIYKIMKVFNPDLYVIQAMFVIPIIISTLSVIPAFFIGKRKAGMFGGFIAGLIVAIHPAFIGRTAGGFADTDAYNVLFPLIIIWLFLESFETKSYRNKAILAALSGFMIGLFSYAWQGWWYLFDFVLAVTIIYILYVIVRRFLEYRTVKKLAGPELKSALMIMVIFVVFSALFVSAFVGFNAFKTGPIQPLIFSTIRDPAKADLWPNVFTTVAELNPASLGSVVNQIGGKTLLLIAFIGVMFTLTRKNIINARDLSLLGLSALYFLIINSQKSLGYFEGHKVAYLAILAIPILIGLLLALSKKDEEIDIKYSLILIIWFIGTIYAGTKGVRFILLLVPAFAIAFGIALGRLQQIISKLISKEFHLNLNIARVVMIVVLCLLLITPLKSAHATAKSEIPSMNDGWFNSLKRIDAEAAPDAIINSWWDFGHWFKAIADRAVTFDGASQNRPMAHWIGKTLLTDDETTAVGILRMLDCGSRLAAEHMVNYTNDTVHSIETINEIIVVDKEEARTILEEKLETEEEVETILKYTHCEPPENYFITSGDMVGKAGVWGHFGSWDFERAYIYNTANKNDMRTAIKLISEELGIEESEAEDYYFQVKSLTSSRDGNTWISPWPNYATQSMINCRNTEEENIVICPLNLNIGRQDNNNIMLEGITINLEKPEESKLLFGIIDRNMNVKVGESKGVPAAIAITREEDIERIPFSDASFSFDVLYDSLNNRALVVDPLLTKSTFTKLFYLNGRYMPHFDNFHSALSINGDRIIIWKVDWDGKTGSELEEWKAQYEPKVEEVVAEEQPEPEEEVEEENTTEG